jgi:hypothetical protein
MIGTIVLVMLLSWLVCTAFMTIRAGSTAQHMENAEPRAQRISAGPAPAATASQDTNER